MASLKRSAIIGGTLGSGILAGKVLAPTAAAPSVISYYKLNNRLIDYENTHPTEALDTFDNLDRTRRELGVYLNDRDEPQFDPSDNSISRISYEEFPNATYAHELGHAHYSNTFDGLGSVVHRIDDITRIPFDTDLTSGLSATYGGYRGYQSEVNLLKNGKRSGFIVRNSHILLPPAMVAPTLAAEAAASMKGIALLKAAGASQSAINLAITNLGAAWLTYASAGLLPILIAVTSHYIGKRVAKYIIVNKLLDLNPGMTRKQGNIIYEEVKAQQLKVVKELEREKRRKRITNIKNWINSKFNTHFSMTSKTIEQELYARKVLRDDLSNSEKYELMYHNHRREKYKRVGGNIGKVTGAAAGVGASIGASTVIGAHRAAVVLPAMAGWHGGKSLGRSIGGKVYDFKHRKQLRKFYVKPKASDKIKLPAELSHTN